MNIYFAGSIRGGYDDTHIYAQIIELLKNYGSVLTEHLGDANIETLGASMTSEEIYNQDVGWLGQADVVVAEVTRPSLGAGYEVAWAEQNNIPVLCIYRPHDEKNLSAMIAGNRNIEIKPYNNSADVPGLFEDFCAQNKLQD